MAFTSNIKNIDCADRIIDFDVYKNQYVIRVNEIYLKSTAFFFLLIGGVLAVVFIPFSFKNFWVGLIGFIVTSLPFLLFGARYFYMSGLKENNRVIDLQKGVIIYSKTLVIPIKTIKNLKVEKTTFFEPRRSTLSLKKIPSWQISIEDHRGNHAVLLKCEDEENTRLISQELGMKLGVGVKRT